MPGTPLEVVLADHDLLEDGDLDGYVIVETTKREREDALPDPTTLYLLGGKPVSGKKINQLAAEGRQIGFPALKMVKERSDDIR